MPGLKEEQRAGEAAQQLAGWQGGTAIGWMGGKAAQQLAGQGWLDRGARRRSNWLDRQAALGKRFGTQVNAKQINPGAGKAGAANGSNDPRNSHRSKATESKNSRQSGASVQQQERQQPTWNSLTHRSVSRPSSRQMSVCPNNQSINQSIERSSDRAIERSSDQSIQPVNPKKPGVVSQSSFACPKKQSIKQSNNE
jgi:hypothetical protein